MSASQITDKLWVGSWSDARQVVNDKDWSVITVANDANVKGQYFFPLTDPGDGENDAAFFEMAIDTTIECLREDKNVLVHCQSGVNRSASVVIAVLMSKHGLGLSEAYEKVFTRRKLIKPQMIYLDRACDYCEKEVPLDFERPKPSFDDAEQVVIKAYKKVLRRKPDPGGLESYTKQIKLGRMSQVDLEKHLYSSGEYSRKFKNE